MANWDFFKLPAGTTPQNAGLNDAPPAGKAYRTHTYSDGTVVWAIVPVQTSSITWPSKTKLGSIDAQTLQTYYANQNNQSGTSTGFFNQNQNSLTQPNWGQFAISNGYKVPDFLKNQSGQSLNISPTVNAFGKLGSTGENLWSAIQNLVVDPATKKTDPAAVELISNWFRSITNNNDVYGLIKSRLTNDKSALDTTSTKNFNAILTGFTNLLKDPASNGNMGNLAPGALTYKAAGGSGSAATVVVTPPTGNTPSLVGQSSASAITQTNALTSIETELQSWGMDSGSLVNRLKKLVFTTGNHIVSTGQLNDWLKSQPEYEAAFPGLSKYNANAAKAGQKPITENAYLGLQNSYTQTARNFDLPQGFLTSQTIAKLIEGGVSAKEFEDRVMLGYEASKKADPQTKAILLQEYGLSSGDLTAFFLNPQVAESTINQRMASATLQGYAKNVGLDLSQAGGENLAGMIKTSTSSVTGAQNPYSTLTLQGAEQAIQKAGQDAQLQKSLPGSGMPTVTTDQQIGAQVPGYMGMNQQVEQIQVGRAEQARVAPFESGGGYDSSTKGVTGIGSARTQLWYNKIKQFGPGSSGRAVLTYPLGQARPGCVIKCIQSVLFNL